jgi:hypothetical protein
MFNFEIFLVLPLAPLISCVCTIGCGVFVFQVVSVYVILDNTSVHIPGTCNRQLRLIYYGKSGFQVFQAQEFESNGVCCHLDSLPNECLKSSRAPGATNTATRAPN